MDYFYFVLTVMAVWIMLTVSANLVLGYTGMFTVGHVGYLAIGAYTSAILNIFLGWNFFLTLPVSVIVTALVAFLTVLPLLRLAPFHFGLSTMGLNVVIVDVIHNAAPRVPGAEGLFGMKVPDIMAGAGGRLVVAIILTAIVLVAMRRVVTAPLGRTLRAVRDQPEALESLGKDPRRYRVLAWTLSGAIAGLAGGLYSTTLFYIDPTVFLVTFSFALLVYVGVGGLASLLGSVLGPLLLITFTEGLRFTGLPSDVSGPLQQTFYGVLLIVIMLFRREGLVGGYRFRD
jgi:branched-chain amino acid transport system permease protein